MKKYILIYLFIATSLQVFCQTDVNKGIIAYWSFDDASEVLLDYSGNKHSSRLFNAKIVDNGKVGKCLRLEKTDKIILQEAINLSNNFTLALWIKPDNITKQQTFFSQYNWSESRYYNFGISNGEIKVNLNDEYTANVYIDEHTIEQNTWTFLAFIVSKNKLTIYKNLEKTENSISFQQNSYERKDVGSIGVDNKGNAYSGLIDEMIIYNRQLSEEEIKQVYNNILPSKIKPTLNQTTKQIDTVYIEKPTTIKTIDNKKIEFIDTIIVKSAGVTIIPYDSDKIDGDKVSININGVWAQRNLLLNKEQQTKVNIKLTLEPEVENYLISYPVSFGTKPPITLTLKIIDNEKTHKVDMKSTEKKCEAILIIYRP